VNIFSHIEELGASPEAEAFRELTAGMRQQPEIEPSADLTRRIMRRIEREEERGSAGKAPAFRPWFGAAAAAAVIAALFGLRVLYPGAGGSCALNNEQWLAAAQETDGSWNPARHGGSREYRPALTALSALALHRSSKKFSAAVESACRYLAGIQQPDGSFGGSDGHEQLYNQAIVTYVLAETGGKNEGHTAVLQRAVACIGSAQSAEGGWDYAEDSQGNAAVTAWQVQALFSAKNSGIAAADIPMRRGLRWLRGAALSDGAVAYSRRSEQSSDTISALAGYALLTAGHDYPELSALGRQVVDAMTQTHSGGASNLYRDCMKLRALKAAGQAAGAEIVRTQMNAGITGSAGDQWGQVGGTLYLSSLQVLAASY